MSQQATVPTVFDEPEFWYKIDVDYEEARDLVQTEDEDDSEAEPAEETSEGESPTPESDEETEEEEDEEDESEGPETIEEALLDIFTRRKKRVIEDKHGSVGEFRQAVLTSDDEVARRLLNEVYVEYIWIQNQDGVIFEGEVDDPAEIDLVDDDENLVQETINEEFDLLWPGRPTIGKEVADGEIVARRYLQRLC